MKKIIRILLIFVIVIYLACDSNPVVHKEDKEVVTKATILNLDFEQVSTDGPVVTDSLPADLAAIWRDGVAENLTWSRLARRSVLRVFTGSGLMVVSGDDPGLHEAAGPLYEKILTDYAALADLAAQRGRDLAASGWHAQINARSLARPLFTVEGDQRAAWVPGSPAPEPARLRPGVMLRSPVQDWLFRPAAVVARAPPLIT